MERSSDQETGKPKISIIEIILVKSGGLRLDLMEAVKKISISRHSNLRILMISSSIQG